MQYGMQETVTDEATRWVCIGYQEALSGFHCNFCSAIQLREADGGHAMLYTPEA